MGHRGASVAGSGRPAVVWQAGRLVGASSEGIRTIHCERSCRRDGYQIGSGAEDGVFLTRSETGEVDRQARAVHLYAAGAQQRDGADKQQIANERRKIYPDERRLCDDLSRGGQHRANRGDRVAAHSTDAKAFSRWNSTVTDIEGEIREGERLRLHVPRRRVCPHEKHAAGFRPILRPTPMI